MLITSGKLTGSSACIRFRMSATRTDALPFARTFGMTPKEDCNKGVNNMFQSIPLIMNLQPECYNIQYLKDYWKK